MSDPALIVAMGCGQTVFLAILAAAMKLWQDRNHAEAMGKIEVVRKDVDGQTHALLRLTAEAEKAKGNLEGRAELKTEQESG